MKNKLENWEWFCILEEKLTLNQLVGVQTDKDINNTFKSVHFQLVNALISLYMEKTCINYSIDDFSNFFEGEKSCINILPSDFDYHIIPQICEKLHISFLNSELIYKDGEIVRKKSKNNLLEAGAVYTQDKIAYEIVSRTIMNLSIEDPHSIKVLDFATGTGRFYKQVIICLYELFGITPNNSIINNIYAVDVDPIAINVCRIYAMSQISDLDENKAAIVSRHIILKNALIKKNNDKDIMAISPSDADGLFYKGFHAIVSNPPYLVLKPNKKKMDETTVKNVTNLIDYFRNSSNYKYAIEGMLNLYQLSIEAMLGMLRQNGELGIICPSTLFADISASTLRKHLLSEHNITYIKYYSEDVPLFDNVTQATCIFHLTKNNKTQKINIAKDNKEYIISLEDVKQVFNSNWEIPSIEKIEWDILRKLLNVPVLKNKSYIRNKRGELDLSLYKEFITLQPTEYRLVRGNMLSSNAILDINFEYVLPSFLDKKSLDYLNNDHGKIRLICQQISNQTQKIRLKFVECEKNDIIGNSCNYITVDERDLPKIKVLLNSALLNWRFKVTSTNNHINNYELDELPIINLELLNEDVFDVDDINRDKKICYLYGLNQEETNYIINQHYETL